MLKMSFWISHGTDLQLLQLIGDRGGQIYKLDVKFSQNLTYQNSLKLVNFCQLFKKEKGGYS